MKIFVGSDHRGFQLKKKVDDALKALGHEVVDMGTHAENMSCDYPQIAYKVAVEVVRNQGSRGVLLCMSGIGHSIAANKVPGAYAALVYNKEAAQLSRQHNDSNVLVLGAQFVSEAEMLEIVKIWLSTPFEGGRHLRRKEQIQNIERAVSLIKDNEGTAPILNKFSSAMGGVFQMKYLQNVDPQVWGAINQELKRQKNNLELIASENIVSPAVLEAAGSVLTNKYAEGYPAARWYNGCEFVDEVEKMAIGRAKELFGGDHINVQPHSGSQANTAVYMSVLKVGDTVMGLDLACGGHLTHGLKINISGRLYHFISYKVDQKTELIDMDEVERLAVEHKPKMIVAGYSAYSRLLDFKRFRAIADKVGAFLFVDMAHFAGLVAAGIHPNPVLYADFVTTTTHKTLRGPRGGMIICKAEFAKKIDGAVFPGTQGGPLMHIVAAKAVAFKEALSPEFKQYQRQVVANSQAFAKALGERGFRIVAAGTDNHLFMVDLRPKKITGKDAAALLDRVQITVNKNLVPFDPEPPTIASGIRIGTPAVTTRGMKEAQMEAIAGLVDRCVLNRDKEVELERIRLEVEHLAQEFPVYADFSQNDT